MYQHFSRPDPCLARCGNLRATVVERRVTNAPDFMRGLRALFVADVHVLPRTTRADLDALVATLAAANPQLLLLGGDYSDTAEGAERFFEALAVLRPPLGCYGVLGNNDDEAWEGRLGELRRVMARAGCALLRNRSVRLRHNGGALWIGGLDDHRYGAPSDAGFYPKRPKSDAYRVLLSHYPVMPTVSPDLMLSGHTHGGQFNLLGVTPFTIGFERVLRRKLAPMAVAGMRDIDGMRLLVSKGIGASRLQLRVGVRSEVELLIFE